VTLEAAAADARAAGPRALIGLAAALGVGVVALAVAAWPVTVCLAAIVGVILLLAWRSPHWSLAAALLVFGFEGSFKILLRLEPTPLPFSGRAVGAAGLDLALFGAVVGVVIAGGERTMRALWRSLTRGERAVVAALLAWIALSALQILQGGHPSRGVAGFRIFQAYVAVAAAAAVVFWRTALRGRLAAALAIGFVVSAYAAARVALGPAGAERDFATSVDTTTAYGAAIRAIGSFSSAVGMDSFLTPTAVFALVVGLLVPRVRVVAWATASLAVVGIIGSYGRAPLFAIAVGLAFAVALLVSGAAVRGRAKLVAVGLLVGVLVAAYGGVRVASESSPALRKRAEGILNPVHDESVHIRANTWKRALERARRRPLGEGVGAVGRATNQSNGRRPVTTDNSFLKVLVEQGLVGAALFYAAIVGSLIAIARRLRRAAGEPRAVGLAALGGFVAFLVLSMTGEYVEQPGKVVAWALLGMAAALAFGTAESAKRPSEST
jgi:O-antigen ligase